MSRESRQAAKEQKSADVREAKEREDREKRQDSVGRGLKSLIGGTIVYVIIPFLLMEFVIPMDTIQEKLDTTEIEALLQRWLYMGLPVAVVCFFKGFFGLGSFKRLGAWVLFTALSIAWIFYVTNFGDLPDLIVAYSGDVLIDVDVYITGALWLIVVLKLLKLLIAACDHMDHRKQYMIENGMLEVDTSAPVEGRYDRVDRMGYNIGICEKEAEGALCKDYKKNIVKVMLLDEKGLEHLVITDEVVDLDTAKKAVGDWEAFIKRNRINEETDAVYMDKVKKDEDIAILKPLVKKVSTGWVVLDGLSASDKEKVMAKADPENIITGWDMVSFDDMNEMCSKCPLSWDKGRGCIGTFGPSNSALPEIASRHGCPIVASVPESAASGKVFTKEDAVKLAAEVEKLKAALPEEGKMAAHRYGGVVERLGDMAEACKAGKCG